MLVPEGGAVAQDIALSAEVVQLAEISVSAEAERGTVNRALEEQRNAANIVNAITAEQIGKSPDGDAGQAVQRVSGVTVQDGRYVFVRGLGERYTTASLNGARIPSPEPERKVVPLDLFPSSLLEGITTSKTFTPDQPGDFSGAPVNLKTREFPARRVITFSASAGSQHRGHRQGPGARARGRAGSGSGSRARSAGFPRPRTAAGNLRGLDQSQINGIIGSFRNAWSGRVDNGSANGGFGLTVGGEDPVFRQPIGYIGSFTYSYGQEVRAEESRSLIMRQSDGLRAAEPDRGLDRAQQRALGRHSQPEHPPRHQHQARSSTTPTTEARTTRRPASRERTRSSSVDLDVTRLTFVQRTVRSHQLTGEHLVGDDQLVDWSLSASRVDRYEPDRSDIAYIAQVDPATGASAAGELAGRAALGHPHVQRSGREQLRGQGNYRLFLGSSANPAIVKVGGAYRAVDRDVDSRAFDITNRGLSPVDRPGAAGTDLRRTLRPGRPACRSSSTRTAAATTRATGWWPATGRSSCQLAARLRLIGGARVEHWTLELNTLNPAGRGLVHRARTTPTSCPRSRSTTSWRRTR